LATRSTRYDHTGSEERSGVTPSLWDESMKAYIANDNTLIIEGENQVERMALRAWEDAFADGDSAFRIGESEQREVKPKVKRVGGGWVEA
jgi:hypothetical protein